MAAAGKATGVHAVAIGGVAAGKYITAGGFVWRWGKAKTIDIKSFREARRRELRKKHGQKVTQYNMKGRKVASYPSLLDAQIASGAHTNAIRLVLKGKYKSAKGYFWKKGYGKENIDLSTYKWGNAAMAATQSKKVKQYTLGGKYIQSFASVKAAAKYMGVNSTTMSGACTGYQKTCGGFKWQFA